MAHDQIEFCDPTFTTCSCCGEVTTHLVRYVTREEAAFAVYFADFSDGHDFVSVLAGFGDWGESASPEQRVAFAFRVWHAENSYQVGLCDPEDTAWKTGYLGRILSREEGLKHPLRAEAFALSDHIVGCDELVVKFLSRLS